MYINKLKLINYRNFTEEEIQFNQHCNMIIGDNAQGKTNIIEAIHLASRGKSFRTKDNNLIKHQEEYAKIIIDFFKNEREQKIEINLFSNQKKTIFINGIKINKFTELFGVVNTIFFSPDDLALIKSGPAERRKFFDREISTVDKQYLQNLIYYYRILSQRNKLLKTAIDNKKQLELIKVYDEQIAVFAEKIIAKRLYYLAKISVFCSEIHSKLSYGQEKINIEYKPTMASNKEKILEQLNANLKQDLKYAHTRIGIHKDDFEIKINEKNSRIFSSQGQQRTAALSLKLSALKLFENELNQKAILLLDDVMSELDNHRQAMIIQEIKNTQTILTTTDLYGLNLKQLTPFYKIIIKNGQVLSSEEYLCQK